MKALLPLLFALLLAACATPDSRIKRNPQIFSTLAPRQQQLVRAGEIDEGLGRDAVFLAWGRPDQIRREQSGGASRERWLYFGSSTEYVPMWGRSHFRHEYPYGVRPVFDLVPVTVPIYWKSVTFERGTVIAWDVPSPR